MTIHSFDAILREPKRMHSFELIPGGKRYPLWRPVAWISVVYFVVIALVFMAVDNLVSVVDLLDVFFAAEASWIIYHVGIPAAIVWVAVNAEIDGRHPHRWVVSYVLLLARPRRTRAGVTVLADGVGVDCGRRVRVWWDLNAPRLHRGWVVGGEVSTAVPVRFTFALRHRKRVVRSDADGVLVCDHDVNGRLEVRP